MPVSIHDITRPILQYFRRRRMKRFADSFHLKPASQVLDVGGNSLNWNLLPQRPQITYLNIDVNFIGAPGQGDTVVVADGRALPFPDQSFEIVFCNSVIEHLADADSQRRLAVEIQRVGRSYFVQTPNYWYPIEPHYVGFGVQFFPQRIRPAITRWLTVWGWLEKPSRDRCKAMVQEIRLLSRREMKDLFPNGDIESERVIGLTKSLIAVRRPVD